MAAGRHFGKKENRHNSAAISDIFTKFGELVAMDSPQHAVMSFLGYKQNPRFGRPPFWKTENRNNSAAIRDIVTKFDKVVGMESPQPAETPFLTCIKIQDGSRPPIWKKIKIALTQPLFQIPSPNLVCRWPWSARKVPWCHFWATRKSKTKSKMAAAAILENFKWPYLWNGSSDPLRVWFYGRVSGVGGSNDATVG